MSRVKRVKGHVHRKINEPGFHLHPRFDLKEFRKRRHMKHAKKSEPGLPLTALIDIFSMLVIFLLMNFSATGEIFFSSKEKIQLPEAGQTNPLKSSPLISITDQAVMFDYPGVDSLRLEDPLAEETLEKLREKLRELKAFIETDKNEENPGNRVNLQADQKTPVAGVKRVMTVLISEGMTDINFAVIHDESN